MTVMPPAVRRTLDLGEVVLAYDEVGDGPPVVYAHGLTSSRRSEDAWTLTDWSPVVAAGRRLVRYDARGHGESTGRPRYTDYTWPYLAGDLLALVDHISGPGPGPGQDPDQEPEPGPGPGSGSNPAPVDVIGASMGCGTLLHAAIRHPERFGRLVLVIPSTAWETRPMAAAANRAAADIIERNGLDSFLAAVKDLPLAPVPAQAPGTPPLPDITESLYPHVMRGSAATDLPDPDVLRALEHPALILTWAGDPGHPVSTAEKLKDLLPNAWLHVSDDYADATTWGERAAAFLTE